MATWAAARTSWNSIASGNGLSADGRGQRAGAHATEARAGDIPLYAMAPWAPSSTGAALLGPPVEEIDGDDGVVRQPLPAVVDALPARHPSGSRRSRRHADVVDQALRLEVPGGHRVERRVEATPRRARSVPAGPVPMLVEVPGDDERDVRVRGAEQRPLATTEIPRSDAASGPRGGVGPDMLLLGPI
jgi:hypothetical protein